MSQGKRWLFTVMVMLYGISNLMAATGGVSRHVAPDAYPSQIVKILRTTNKAQTNTYVPVVFELKNVNPFSVIRFLRRPVQLEEGLVYTFANPDGTSGKVLYAVPQYMIPYLEKLIQVVDRPGLTSSSGDLRIYRPLKHRRADLSDLGFVQTATSYLTGNGSQAIVDPAVNALWWEDAPSGSKTLDGALSEFLDKPTPMLQLQVKVYEVEVTNDAEIGLDYMAWKNGPGANLLAAGAFSEYGALDRASQAVFDPLGTSASGLHKRNFDASGWNYAFQYQVSSAFFDFLAAKGKARMLNASKLAALNTRTATMSAGDQIIYYDVQSSEPDGVRNTGDPFEANGGRVVTGTGNRLVSSDPDTLEEALIDLLLSIEGADDLGDLSAGGGSDLQPVETGLQLQFTPVIGEQTVNLDLDLDWSDFTGFDDQGFPQLNSRTLSTTVRLALGDEIIIGGLERQHRIKSTEKVPFLGSLPIIGFVFGGEAQRSKTTEMVVAIKALGVFDYDLADARAVSDEDHLIIEQATGNQPIEVPQADLGFQMIGLDDAYTVGLE